MIELIIGVAIGALLFSGDSDHQHRCGFQSMTPRTAPPPPPPPNGGTDTRADTKARYKREGRPWVEPPAGGMEHEHNERGEKHE